VVDLGNKIIINRNRDTLHRLFPSIVGCRTYSALDRNGNNSRAMSLSTAQKTIAMRHGADICPSFPKNPSGIGCATSGSMKNIVQSMQLSGQLRRKHWRKPMATTKAAAPQEGSQTDAEIAFGNRFVMRPCTDGLRARSGCRRGR
jgi:hypothetical protein